MLCALRKCSSRRGSISVYEGDRYHQGLVVPPSEPTPFCTSLTELLFDIENQTDSSLPPELLSLFATTNQVRRAAKLRFNPVICRRCKCWLKNRWALLWHAQCCTLCYLAAHELYGYYGRLPVTADPSHFLEVAYLASQTSNKRDRSRLFWRHMGTAAIQTAFAKFINTDTLSSMWRSYLSATSPGTKFAHPTPPSYVFRLIGTYIPLLPQTRFGGRQATHNFKHSISTSFNFSVHQDASVPFIDTD